MMFLSVITGLIVVISTLMDYLFSFFQILFKRPMPPTGAVEIDEKEHIYAHPTCTKGLRDLSPTDAKTIHEAFLTGLRLRGDRPQYSFRQSSDQSFQSYTYKYE